MNSVLLVLILTVFLALGGVLLYRWLRKRSADADASLPGGSTLKERGQRAATVVDFYVRGNQQGFSLGELRALHGLARRFAITDPNNMLLSQSHLDRSLKEIIRQGAVEGILGQDDMVKLLGKIFEYRMGLEKNRPRYRKGLDSTRLIDAGQYLKILLPGKGVHQVKVIENFRTYIAVEKPSGKGVQSGHSWKDQRLDVYFWRKGDALYYFEAFVLNDPDQSSMQPVLHLTHSEKLVRTQKRNAIRVKVMKMGSLLPLGDGNAASDVWNPALGYQCKVTDISETGAAILVRGKVLPGRMVKLQVELGGLPVVMCGEIKGSTLNAAYNVSLLHIEAMPPLSMVMAIRVQAFVLGLVTEEAPVEVAAAGDGLGENHQAGEAAASRENLDSLPQEEAISPADMVDAVPAMAPGAPVDPEMKNAHLLDENPLDAGQGNMFEDDATHPRDN